MAAQNWIGFEACDSDVTLGVMRKARVKWETRERVFLQFRDGAHRGLDTSSAQ